MSRWLRGAIWALIALIPFAWFPYFEETFVSAKWITVYLTAFCAALGARRSLAATENLVVVAILVSMVAVDGWNGRPSAMVPFTFVALAAIYAFVRGEDRVAVRSALLNANILSASLVMIIVAVGIGLTSLGHPSAYLVNPFGHANYLAEFLALSSAIQFFEYLGEGRSGTRSRLRWIRLACVLASAVFVLALRARAALVGLTLSMTLIAVFFRADFAARRGVKYALGALMIVVPIVFIFPNVFWRIHGLDPSGPSIGEIKSASAEIRRARWRNTVEMIRERPFGHGSTGYEWGYLPFSRRKAVDLEINEAVIATSSHNIILDLAVKYGIHVLLGAIVLFWLYLRRMRKEWDKADEGARRSLKLSLIGLACILTIALFSIPFDAGVMNAYFACFLALGAPCAAESGSASSSWVPRAAVAAVIAAGAALYAFANWSYSMFNQNYRDFATACRLLPEMSENCVKKAFYESETWLDRAAAKATLEKILQREPNHFVARQMLARLSADGAER